MLVTLFDLQLEEEEEAKAESDKTQDDELDKNVLGKDEDVAAAIKSATEAATYSKKNLGIALREVSGRILGDSEGGFVNSMFVNITVIKLDPDRVTLS